jgi:hypothetical protein
MWNPKPPYIAIDIFQSVANLVRSRYNLSDRYRYCVLIADSPPWSSVTILKNLLLIFNPYSISSTKSWFHAKLSVMTHTLMYGFCKKSTGKNRTWYVSPHGCKITSTLPQRFVHKMYRGYWQLRMKSNPHLCNEASYTFQTWSKTIIF